MAIPARASPPDDQERGQRAWVSSIGGSRRAAAWPRGWPQVDPPRRRLLRPARGQLGAVRGPGDVGQAPGNGGQLLQLAAVGPDRESLVVALAVRVERQALPVGRPGHAPVAEGVVGELPEARPVGADDEHVLATLGREGDPLAVRRERLVAQLQRAAEHDRRRARDPPAEGIERRPHQRRPHVAAGVGEGPPVAREAGVAGPAGGGGERHRRAERLTARLVDRDPPQVHRPPAVAREGEVPPVGRPHRVPVDGDVGRHRDRAAPGRRHREDVPLTRYGRRPSTRRGGRGATSGAGRRRRESRSGAGPRRRRRSPRAHPSRSGSRPRPSSPWRRRSPARPATSSGCSRSPTAA